MWSGEEGVPYLWARDDQIFGVIALLLIVIWTELSRLPYISPYSDSLYGLKIDGSLAMMR